MATPESRRAGIVVLLVGLSIACVFALAEFSSQPTTALLLQGTASLLSRRLRGSVVAAMVGRYEPDYVLPQDLKDQLPQELEAQAPQPQGPPPRSALSAGPAAAPAWHLRRLPGGYSNGNGSYPGTNRTWHNDDDASSGDGGDTDWNTVGMVVFLGFGVLASMSLCNCAFWKDLYFPYMCGTQYMRGSRAYVYTEESTTTTTTIYDDGSTKTSRSTTVVHTLHLEYESDTHVYKRSFNWGVAEAPDTADVLNVGNGCYHVPVAAVTTPIRGNGCMTICAFICNIAIVLVCFDMALAGMATSLLLPLGLLYLLFCALPTPCLVRYKLLARHAEAAPAPAPAPAARPGPAVVTENVLAMTPVNVQPGADVGDIHVIAVVAEPMVVACPSCGGRVKVPASVGSNSRMLCAHCNNQFLTP